MNHIVKCTLVKQDGGLQSLHDAEDVELKRLETTTATKALTKWDTIATEARDLLTYHTDITKNSDEWAV